VDVDEADSAGEDLIVVDLGVVVGAIHLIRGGLGVGFLVFKMSLTRALVGFSLHTLATDLDPTCL